MRFDLDKWYLKKSEGDVLYKYRGSISQVVVIKALDTIEKNLNLADADNKIRRKVFSVFVESIQNLFHHADNIPVNSNMELSDTFGAIVLVCEQNSPYRISTGNFVHLDKIGNIKDRIDQVNSLSEEEIKMLYREILGKGGFSPKGGGGLGILDIARKTGNKMEYNIYPVTDEFVFFALDVYIS
ncbi:MAG: SiaB family protein kinase [Cytophagaceae bacterium]|jgi:hypothetical protein|nr:SiaB family protein kinase [Cytophagaceae bacterium]